MSRKYPLYASTAAKVTLKRVNPRLAKAEFEYNKGNKIEAWQWLASAGSLLTDAKHAISDMRSSATRERFLQEFKTLKMNYLKLAKKIKPPRGEENYSKRIERKLNE